MAKMSLGDFLDHYGIHTAIAALAVIVEDEAKDKKRIIHDATHGVRVNPDQAPRQAKVSRCQGEETPATRARGGREGGLLGSGGHR